MIKVQDPLYDKFGNIIDLLPTCLVLTYILTNPEITLYLDISQKNRGYILTAKSKYSQ